MLGDLQVAEELLSNMASLHPGRLSQKTGAAFSDVVVDKSALGVHQVELVVNAGKDFGDGGAVRDPQETNGQTISTRNYNLTLPDSAIPSCHDSYCSARNNHESAAQQHAAGTHHLCQITAGHHGWRLVVDTALEAGGAPVHKLDGTLCLDGGNCGVHILRHDIATFMSDSTNNDMI